MLHGALGYVLSICFYKEDMATVVMLLIVQWFGRRKQHFSPVWPKVFPEFIDGGLPSKDGE